MSSKVKCKICKQYFPKGEIKYQLALGNICSDECLKRPKKVKKLSPESKVSKTARKEAKGKCQAGVSPECQRTGNHIHHRRMRSSGGKDERVNLVLLCLPCHSMIHLNPEKAYDTGWLVKSWQNPAEIKPIRGLWK